MKTLPKHHNYILYFYFPIFLIALILILFFPQQILICFKAHWLIPLFAFILALSPIGKIRLGHKQPLNIFKWLSLILITEIAIILLYWGVVFVILQGLPLLATTSAENVLLATEKNFVWNWGLFPWAIITMIAIILGYFSFYKNQKGLLSVTLQPLLKNIPEDPISITTDFLARLTIFFSLALAIGIGSLQLLSILSDIFQIPIYTGLRFGTLLIATAIMLIMNTPNWNKFIRFLSTKSISPAITITVITLVLAIGVLILNLGTNFLAENFPQLKQTILAIHPDTQLWLNHWLIFSGMWWLSWLPLLAGMIAYLSQGYQIRTVIVGSLLMGIVGNLFFIGLIHSNLIMNQFKLLNYFLPLLGFGMIMIIFLRTKYLAYAMRATVPDSEKLKSRSPHFFIRALTQTAGFIILLYLVAGIFTLNAMTFIMIFPIALFTLMTCISFGKILIKSKN